MLVDPEPDDVPVVLEVEELLVGAGAGWSDGTLLLGTGVTAGGLTGLGAGWGAGATGLGAGWGAGATGLGAVTAI